MLVCFLCLSGSVRNQTKLSIISTHCFACFLLLLKINLDETGVGL